jgi:thioester reductase-like protein
MKRVYFVTGATGTVGSALVPFLLADPDAEMWLLLRAEGPQALAARLEALHGFWGHASDAAERSRVRALAGDVERPRFGLTAADHAALTRVCTHIVHCAGKVRMNLPLEAARSAAVASARNVVELARACPGLQKIEFVSTVGVGGRLPGTLPEAWITAARAFHNTYEQAKAEAEDLIRAEVERGLPLTVHRPSMVVGEAATGRVIHFQIFYHLCEFLSGRRTHGFTPRLGEARLDIIPADYVGRALAWASQSPATAGRVLHLCAGPHGAIPLVELQRRVRESWQAQGIDLPPLRALPPGWLRAALPLLRLLTPAPARRALNALPIFLDYLADTQAFANDATCRLLEAAGIVAPAPTEYLDRLFAYYFRHGNVSGRV